MVLWKIMSKRNDQIEDQSGRENAWPAAHSYAELSIEEFAREASRKTCGILPLASTPCCANLPKSKDTLPEKWSPTFCDRDYVSGDGFQTSVWGPCTWVTFHLFSLNYTPARKRGYQQLIDGLKQTLPCIHCRNNFEKNWKAAMSAMHRRGIRDPWSSRGKLFSTHM